MEGAVHGLPFTPVFHRRLRQCLESSLYEAHFTKSVFICESVLILMAQIFFGEGKESHILSSGSIHGFAAIPPPK